ncbi:AAA family ATPase [Bacillus sp. CRN 9]|nr:AAA family ATPase [Bacillus sp. CRN 9]
MKITEIHIYGFGKLNDLFIDNLQEFQVFFGENEAGKSTIMAFIHSILFGFPTKQQAERRFEPKHGASYGGKLMIDFPIHGRTVIERVKGKAATGDVIVFLEDGTKGGEALLKELLHRVDKNLFQSVFSFNIHGLQNVQQIKGEDLGKFLFSAGAIGTDRILIAEQSLQKELEDRFKPNGNKPLINMKLKEMKQINHDLKKAERKNAEYWTRLQKKEMMENQLKRLQSERIEQEVELKSLKEWEQIEPLYLQYKLLQEEAGIFEPVKFPVDGLARLDRLESAIDPLEAQKASLASRIQLLKAEIDQVHPHAELLNKENEIHSAVESLPLWEKLKQEEEELTFKLNSIEEEIVLLGEKLHLPIDKKSLINLDTSVFMKDKILKAAEKYRKLQDRKQDLDERFEEERQALTACEERLAGLKRNILQPEERIELQSQLSFANEKKQLQQELDDIFDRQEMLKKVQRTRSSGSKKKGERIQFTLFTGLFIILASWGFWSGNWLIALTGICGMIFSIYTLMKRQASRSDDFFDSEMLSLKEREKSLREKINGLNPINTAETETLLKKDDELQLQMSQTQLQLKQINEQYEKIIYSYEEWEAASVNAEKVLIDLSHKLELPESLALFHLVDAFNLIEQLKALVKEKGYLIERRDAAAKRINEIVSAFESLYLLINEDSTTIQECAYMLKKKLKEEMEKQIKQKEMNVKLLELEEEWQSVNTLCDHYLEERFKLLTLVNADSIEAYRELGNKFAKKESIEEQLRTLHLKLKMASLTFEEMEKLDSLINIRAKAREIQHHLANIEEEISLLQKQMAENQYEISLIEEGGIYADLLHTYKLKKAELEEHAKEWATYAAAKNVLARAVERFQEERLPKILTKAEEYFSILTNNKYCRIYLHKEVSTFHIENNEGDLFEAKELSQATAEQLYLSFRLALAETVYGKYSFPIIIDDSFVNFDHHRTEKVIELLKKIKGKQILFFTCHQHHLKYFSAQQLIEVSKTTSTSA